ncbi:helix-turn-helix domain-containing protein [Pseudonocardia sp. CA-142604]|uniref:helix-turn-helix domain-containing protein n=1 Tax=Pseudonocardia sp. CA-142604 TaxID=3240024 RepID=UPI003D91E59F
MQIVEYSGEELEHVACEFSIPVIARACPDFQGRLAVQKLGDTLTLSRSRWGQMSAVRTTRMTAGAQADNLMLFSVHLAGRGRVRQHDRCVELAPGAGVLAEARSRYERVSSGEARCMNLRFSRERLPLRTAEITEACARSVNPAAPAMQMLSGYLVRLFEVADDLTAPQRLDAGQAAIDLLAMALRDITSVPGGDGPDEVLLDMMRMHVREHLDDPDLKVEELARRHHVSVGRVYSLFARIGTTPAAYLRDQRLLAARTMLSDPRNVRRRVSDIAAAVGFLDLRTFERAFRRQNGMTPVSWRREHCHSGFGPVAPEAANAPTPSRKAAPA